MSVQNVGVSEPTLQQILRETFSTAPAATRRSAVAGLLVWLGVMALQGLDSANDEGPAAVAEFLSALCGSAGGVLFAVTGLLSATAERQPAFFPILPYFQMHSGTANDMSSIGIQHFHVFIN